MKVATNTVVIPEDHQHAMTTVPVVTNEAVTQTEEVRLLLSYLDGIINYCRIGLACEIYSAMYRCCFLSSIMLGLRPVSLCQHPACLCSEV